MSPDPGPDPGPDAATTRLKLEQIRTDGGTQPRGELDLAVVGEYAEALRVGTQFPPVEVVYDGTDYWLWDGFHRVQGARYAHVAEIAANVRQGTLQDAQWLSYGANQTHGLRRSNEDKQRAVKAALLHPRGTCKSDRQIGAHVGVDHRTVSRWRADLELSGEIPQIDERAVVRNGTTYTQNTARIGVRPEDAAPLASLPFTPLRDDIGGDKTRGGETPPPQRGLGPVAHPALLGGYSTQAVPGDGVTRPPSLRSRSHRSGMISGVIRRGDAETATAVPPLLRPLPPRSAAEWAAPPLLCPSAPPPHSVGPVAIHHHDARHLAGCVPAGSVHLVITSPPYNVGMEYGQHDDALPEAEYWGLLRDVFGQCWEAMAPGGRIAVVVPVGVGRAPWEPLASEVVDLLRKLRFTVRGQIVWDKGSTANRTSWGSWRLPSNPSLRDTTEAIVVAHKLHERLEVPEAALAREEGALVSPWLPAELFMELAQDHWQVPPESAQAVGHPAPFPVALAERLARFYAYPGAHLLDPFAGSGTVGVAALRLGCRATLVEIDGAYCELAEARCRREQR